MGRPRRVLVDVLAELGVEDAWELDAGEFAWSSSWPGAAQEYSLENRYGVGNRSRARFPCPIEQSNGWRIDGESILGGRGAESDEQLLLKCPECPKVALNLGGPGLRF